MIQLSPPIQSVESPEARQGASLSPDHEKTEKKEGREVFAKLLAGLLQKNGKPGAGRAASAVEGHETGEGARPGGIPEVPFLSGAGETKEVRGKVDSPRGGKKLRASPLRDGETAEESAKTDVLSGTEKKRVKSRSREERGAEVERAAGLASTRSDPADGGGAVEGEEVLAAQVGPKDGPPAGGEETLEAAAPNGDDAVVSYTLTEAAGEDRPGLRKRDLPAGELARNVAEVPPAELSPGETPGSVRNIRLSVRETVGRDGRSPGEIRLRDRSRDRAGSEAGDIRAGLDKRDRTESLRSLAEAGKGDAASLDKGIEQSSKEQGSKEQSSAELTVELRSLGKTQGEFSAERENRPIQSFQNTLARELHENLNGDIVRHASVMLRDGGEGTIRLSLRPETLGSVKIRLEITENRITGRITVESGEAFKAFEQELHSLEQSFRDSGFDGASLEMAFASDGREGRQGRDGEADSLFPGHRAALSYDAALSVLSENPEEGQWLGIRLDSQGRPLVNMLV